MKYEIWGLSLGLLYTPHHQISWIIIISLKEQPAKQASPLHPSIRKSTNERKQNIIYESKPENLIHHNAPQMTSWTPSNVCTPEAKGKTNIKGRFGYLSLCELRGSQQRRVKERHFVVKEICRRLYPTKIQKVAKLCRESRLRLQSWNQLSIGEDHV